VRVNALRIALAVAVMGTAGAQSSDTGDAPSENWNLYFQATPIGDYHGNFRALYSGAHSLQNTWERDASLTSTLYLGLRLPGDTQIYIDPELAGGRGFSGVDGVANAPNGELPRVASATPKPYLARAYITHDFGFGDEREVTSSDENQQASRSRSAACPVCTRPIWRTAAWIF
jgi:high affinity Mn2+ porin